MKASPKEEFDDLEIEELERALARELTEERRESRRGRKPKKEESPG